MDSLLSVLEYFKFTETAKSTITLVLFPINFFIIPNIWVRNGEVNTRGGFFKLKSRANLELFSNFRE